MRTTWDLFSIEWKGFHAPNSALPTTYAHFSWVIPFLERNFLRWTLKIHTLENFPRTSIQFINFILSLIRNKYASGLLRQHFLYERCAIVCPHRPHVLCGRFYKRVRNKVKVENMYINLMTFQSTAPNTFVCINMPNTTQSTLHITARRPTGDSNAT